MPIVGVLPSDYVPPILLEYLVVAGGGSAGGGGGGAGGLITNYGSPVGVTIGSSHSVVIGAGGAYGSNGSNSSLTINGTAITAIGGGRGGEYGSPNGANGGSGGGASLGGTPGQGTAGQGNAGGSASTGDGGGGGAGQVGYNGVSRALNLPQYGAGGDGLSTPVGGIGSKFSGGGAGSVGDISIVPGGLIPGGDGGGGDSYGQFGSSNGEPNTGGGGGGPGASGGSGIVVLQYPKDYAIQFSEGVFGVTYELGSSSKITKIIGGAGTFKFVAKYSSTLSAGTLDGTFTTSATSGPVKVFDVSQNQNLFIGGTFATINGLARTNFSILNSAGTIISANSAVNNTVNAIEVVSDTVAYVGGLFTSWDTTTVGRFVKIDGNGLLNKSFNTAIGSGFNGEVNDIAVQSDGKIVVVGSFTSFNGATANRIARLNTSGTLDSAFMTNIGTGPNSVINAVEILSNGKIVVGGDFTTWKGSTRTRFAALNSDGNIDTTFGGTGGPNAAVLDIAKQSNENLIFVGSFTTWDGSSAPYITRINAFTAGFTSAGYQDGTFLFGVGTNGIIRSASILMNDNILIAGDFTGYTDGFNPIVTINRVAMLDVQGNLDATFDINIGTGANNSVYAVYGNTDGKVYIGGNFTQVNGVSKSLIARIGSGMFV